MFVSVCLRAFEAWKGESDCSAPSMRDCSSLSCVIRTCKKHAEMSFLQDLGGMSFC